MWLGNPILITIRLNNIPVEFCHIDLGKGQQRSAEYLQVNPLGKVPALEVIRHPSVSACAHAQQHHNNAPLLLTGW